MTNADKLLIVERVKLLTEYDNRFVKSSPLTRHSKPIAKCD